MHAALQDRCAPGAHEAASDTDHGTKSEPGMLGGHDESRNSNERSAARACCGSEPSASGAGRSRDWTQPFEPHRCTAGIDHWEQGLRWTRLPLRHRHRFGACGDMVSLRCLSALLRSQVSARKPVDSGSGYRRHSYPPRRPVARHERRVGDGLFCSECREHQRVRMAGNRSAPDHCASAVKAWRNPMAHPNRVLTWAPGAVSPRPLTHSSLLLPGRAGRMGPPFSHKGSTAQCHFLQ